MSLRHWSVWLPLTLAVVLGFVLVAGLGPISRWNHHGWKAAMCLVALGLSLALPRLRAGARGRPMWTGWWSMGVLAAILAGGAHWNFDRTYAMGLSDHTDPTYYYLNSKYFDELQYDGLYEAMLQSDREGPNRVTNQMWKVRNLRDYQLEPAAAAYARAPEVKARFTPERWNQFTHDARWFMARKSPKALAGHFFLDHGYNPPPPWTLAGGALSRNIPVEHVKIAAMVDVLLLAIMVVVVGWSFGPEVGLLVLLWFFASFSTRWPVLGHVILRYDWVAALGVGVSLLNRDRHGLGGAALTWAALVRVFPAVFWGGALLAYLADALHRRKITRPLVTFVAGSALFAGFVGVGTLADVGVRGWKASIENLRMHDADPEAFSSQKVGLGDLAFFRFETTREEMAASSCGFLERTVAGIDCETHGGVPEGQLKGNGIAGKGELVHAVRPWLRALGVLTLIFMAVYVYRTRKRPADFVHTGFLLVWIMTTPSFYYYSLRVVLVLFHLAHIDRKRHKVGLALVLLTEAATNLLVPTPWVRYFVTGSTSLLLGLWVVWWFAVAAYEMWRGEVEPSCGESLHVPDSRVLSPVSPTEP